MLFCIYEVFEAVNTAGLSLKMVRYCFGLKRNPRFGFNHTMEEIKNTYLLTRILRVIFYVFKNSYKISKSYK